MKKRYDLLFSLTLFGAFAVIALVLAPILETLNANSVYKNSILPVLINTAISIIQTAAFLVAYSVMFYCAYKFTVKKTANQMIVFVCALLFYYVASNLIYYLDKNSFYFVEVIYTAILPFLLDGLLHSLIVGVGILIIGRRGGAECMPFESLISFSNPLQRAIGWGALVQMAVRLADRIAYDVRLGAPEGSKETLEMVFYYLSDVFVGIVAYFVMTYLVISFYARDKKEKADA